jgi:polyhydroxybutyrate depolymerase
VPVDVDPDGDGDPLLGSREAPLTVQALGRTREYYVRMPATYDADTPYPVIFFFHGDTNLAQLPKGLEGRGFFGAEGILGDEAILVYVDGENLNLAGRDTPEEQSQFFSWDASTLPPNNPDIAFFDAMLTKIQVDYCVDTGATFAVGFSGGGFFVNSLGCLRGGLTAIATYQGGFEDGSLDSDVIVDFADCVADAPAALIVHAETDATVVAAYGEIASGHWAEAQSCDDSTTPSSLDTNCVEFSGCDRDVVYCTPECAEDRDRDGVCEPTTDGEPDGDQHAVWRPEGPRVVADFFRRFF